MQDKYIDTEGVDLAQTDELPVLSEEAVLAAGGKIPTLEDTLADEDATGRHPLLFAADRVDLDSGSAHDAAALATLEAALDEARHELAASLRARAELKAALDQRDAALAMLEAEHARQRRQAGELRAALKQYQQRQTGLQDQLTAAKSEVTKQARLAAENATAAQEIPQHRDEIQTLTAYITGSRERWNQMEARLGAETERITDLKRELAQRIERQQSIEQAAHDAAAQVAELKAKLAEAMTTLRARDRDLALMKRAKAAERARAAQHDLSAELAQHRALLEERDKALAAASEERAGLEARLAEALAALERQRQDPARLEQRLLEKDRAVGRQDERIAALQQELSERMAALRKLEITPVSARASANGTRVPAAHANTATDRFPVLVCLTSDRPEKHVIADAEMIIGRGAECAIRVPTHFVSREHARLKRENGKVTIEDCGSTNGVFVNSIRVDRRQLEDGDWVTIGETQFRFLYEGAS